MLVCFPDKPRVNLACRKIIKKEAPNGEVKMHHYSNSLFAIKGVTVITITLELLNRYQHLFQNKTSGILFLNLGYI